MFIERLSADLPMLLVRVATVSFFSIGFIQYFHRLWRDTFETDPATRSHGAFIARRVALMLLTVGLGLFIHTDAMLFIHNDSAIIYHNWAIFVMVVPLMFDGYNVFEVGMQGAGLAAIWYMHHAPGFWQANNLATFMAFVGAIALLKVFHEYVMTNWWIGVAGSVVVASLFWLTMPAESMGMHITTEYGLQAVLLNVLMIAFVLGYWLRQYREDERNRQLERLAEYEKGSHENSYANHQKELAALFETTKETGGRLSFATLDLDHFRRVNERYGHLGGNAVLIEVAALIEDTLQQSHQPYRLFATTGEEYNVVFPDVAPEFALPVIQACWQAVRKSQFPYEERHIDVTLSAGLTAMHPDDESVNDIYKRADDALSKCKQSGRDAVAVEGKLVATSERVEKHLSEYAYFGQGIHDMALAGNPRVGAELLLRTYDSALRRWILPDTFEIPVWMQISLMQAYMTETGTNVVNVNLTAMQFSDLDTAQALAEFAESPEGPDCLNVEITALSDSQTTRRISARYRAAGVKIWIDDVGSDNSFELVRPSLPYINGIKFAMQNLRKVASQAELRERVMFWYQVAEENELDFILEGVETAEDQALALELGIQKGQGYLYSKPVNPSEKSA